MKIKEEYGVFLRYAMIILAGLKNLWLFYFVLTPLTIYPVYFLLHFIFDTTLSGNIIYISSHVIEIIPACVAGSAYYLLLILNLSIPKIKFPQRIKMIALSFAVLLLINILRIFVLVLLLDSKYFSITHELFWYFLSTIFVIGIWFSEVKLFKIKSIPLYSDIKSLYRRSNLKK